MLKRLEEKKLIKSFPSKEDKRKKVIELTALGLEQEAIGNEISDRLSEVFYQDFSDEEINEVEHLLERILRNLENESAKFPRK